MPGLPGRTRKDIEQLPNFFLRVEMLNVLYLSNSKRFPCLYSLIQTREGLGEFKTVMQTQDGFA